MLGRKLFLGIGEDCKLGMVPGWREWKGAGGGVKRGWTGGIRIGEIQGDKAHILISVWPHYYHRPTTQVENPIDWYWALIVFNNKTKLNIMLIINMSVEITSCFVYFVFFFNLCSFWSTISLPFFLFRLHRFLYQNLSLFYPSNRLNMMNK